MGSEQTVVVDPPVDEPGGVINWWANVAPPKNFNFEPQPDMTPVEAAWVGILFGARNDVDDVEKFMLEKGIIRHFKEVPR
jgi:hypothetical protein